MTCQCLIKQRPSEEAKMPRIKPQMCRPNASWYINLVGEDSRRSACNSTMHALLSFLTFHLLLSLGPNALGSVIINGGAVPDKDMLYMASVQNNSRHACGGFLIREDFVLTAAHCDTKNLTVVLGTHNIKRVDESMRYNVKKCKHPRFNKTEKGNDIMLLKLVKKAQLGKRIQPIQIPKVALKLKDNQKCQVAGWGFMKQRKWPADLQMAEVPVVNMKDCRKEWSQKPAQKRLSKDALCAGGHPGITGFCQGDSGGPLVCGGQAVGIVSFNYDRNCDYPNIPNVYVDISKHLNWINTILKKRTC